jgi:predicted dehydrogenase
MKYNKEKVSLAIIGSGAIAEEGYLPAAATVSNIIVTHVVDLDAERAKEVAGRYYVPNVVTDYRELFGKVNAAVVATPPTSHAAISIDCLNHGLHVLCEKPLATSVEEAKEMIAAQERMGTYLAVGMIRRLSWSSQLVKKLVEIGVLGEIDRFDVEEGWEFNWPLRTGHIFQGHNSRGVVADTGTHLFDLLLWILGSQHAHVVSCEDDNWGGIEANASAELIVETFSRTVMGKIELSFTRRLRNTIRIYGDTGCLEASTVGANEVHFFPIGENENPIILTSQYAKPKKKNEDFFIQLSNFADSIINGSQKYVPAEEAVKTITLIEEFYQSRKPTAQSWDMMHLESFFGGVRNG